MYIYNLIEEIDGKEAKEFLRSEQESQDDIFEPDSQQRNENPESLQDFEEA